MSTLAATGRIVVLAASLLLAAVLARALSAAMSSMGGLLVVECSGSETVFPLQGEVRVIYNWTHSVEGTIVVEEYRVDPARGLVLILAAAKSLGAGHPYNAEELGGTFYYKGDLMYYTANLSIGRSLGIEAYSGYTNRNITVIWNGERLRVCQAFYEASIRVEP